MADPQAALQLADAAWADDPFDEEAVRLLMTASREAGATSRGLQAYARLREVLRDELGSDPADETQTLHLQLLGHLEHGEPRRPAPAPRTGCGPAIRTAGRTRLRPSRGQGRQNVSA